VSGQLVVIYYNNRTFDELFIPLAVYLLYLNRNTMLSTKQIYVLHNTMARYPGYVRLQ